MFIKKLLSPFFKPKKTYIPWNKGLAVGAKKPLTLDEANRIKTHLEKEKKWRDLAIFSCGFDTMLRGIDLLHLKVSDVQNVHGDIRKELPVRQHKTGHGVLVGLTEYTQRTLKEWIRHANLKSSDYLFVSERGIQNRPITTDHLRRLIKSWVREIGLDPKEYSSHSLRRTKVSILHNGGLSKTEEIRNLLGHRHLSSTQFYLDTSRHQALNTARQIQLGKQLTPAPNSILIKQALETLSKAEFNFHRSSYL